MALWPESQVLSPSTKTVKKKKKKSIFSGGCKHCGCPVLNREHLAQTIVFLPYLLRVRSFRLSKTEGKLDFTANFPMGSTGETSTGTLHHYTEQLQSLNEHVNYSWLWGPECQPCIINQQINILKLWWETHSVEALLQQSDKQQILQQKVVATQQHLCKTPHNGVKNIVRKLFLILPFPYGDCFPSAQPLILCVILCNNHQSICLSNPLCNLF